ncbi:REST corepressor isoform X2 [Melanaphis sacchari]|uniref:REST corepressor isoform X2 n=1 Tax=Melanaphis sacchari TaxID=742174 RepID=UPI000DC14797|nr:REST corepressor isoform X2 [Melanaphis sacchari]
MANDNSEDLKNGKRPAPSANAEESEIDELIQENVEKIRVGRDYQAVIPKLLVLPKNRRERLNKKALLVWSPTENISEIKLNEYILLSKEKYGYNSEQALGMLYWHHHDMEKALSDLSNFAPLPDDWSTDDKVTFESAFNSIGKNFVRIKQMMPDKPIASLVKYYYLWKNKRKKNSVIDRQAKKLANVRANENQNGSGEVVLSSPESESDDKKDLGEGSSKQECTVCGVEVTMIYTTIKGLMCGTCQSHFKTNGGIRPTLGPPRPNNRHLNVARNKRLPPRGMYVNHDDLQSIASGSNGQGDTILTAMEDEVVSLKCKIQSNKQDIGHVHKKLKLDVDEYRNSEPETNSVQNRWTNDEVMLAIEGMRRYGKDFKAIAEAMGTKTHNHLKSFYTHYRKSYKLDTILKKYEEEKNAEQNPDQHFEDNSEQHFEDNSLVIELRDDEDVLVKRKNQPSSSKVRQSTPSSLASGTRLINLGLNSKTHQTAAVAK